MSLRYNCWKEKGEPIYGLFSYYVSGLYNSAENGYSVSLSGDGNVKAIGEPFYDKSSGSPSENKGRIRVYVWNNNNWSQKGPDIIGTQVNDQIGFSVSLNKEDGNIVATGSPNSQKVRVYEYNNNNRSQKGL